MKNLDIEVILLAVGGFAVAGYFIWAPLKEDWLPLDLETDRYSALYVDGSSVRWSGEKVMFYTKTISKRGGPFSSIYLMPDQRVPTGIRDDWALDCQQRRLSHTQGYIFASEGHYAIIPKKPNEMESAPIVMDETKSNDSNFLSICNTQRAGWNPFRQELIWNMIRIHRDENIISLTDWVEMRRTGNGAATWADGSRYTGEFLEGKKHGRGSLIFPNGDKYEGDFVNDITTGKGVYSWASGHRYEGNFDDKGTQTGEGVYIWPNGDRFEGEFINGKVTNGVYTFINGTQKHYQNGIAM